MGLKDSIRQKIFALQTLPTTFKDAENLAKRFEMQESLFSQKSGEVFGIDANGSGNLNSQTSLMQNAIGKIIQTQKDLVTAIEKLRITGESQPTRNYS